MTYAVTFMPSKRPPKSAVGPFVVEEEAQRRRRRDAADPARRRRSIVVAVVAVVVVARTGRGLHDGPRRRDAVVDVAMVILTAYVSGTEDHVDVESGVRTSKNRPIMCMSDFEGDGSAGTRHLRHGQQPEGEPYIHDMPTIEPFWAAGFSFGIVKRRIEEEIHEGRQ